MTKPFCPHCGYDLALDSPILLNGFSMLGPGASLCWFTLPIKLTDFERNLCWTLMKGYPHAVTAEVLLDRMGSEATGNAIDVFVCRIRKKLRDIGAPNPIKTTRRHNKRAYIWDIGGGDEIASENAEA